MPFWGNGHSGRDGDWKKRRPHPAAMLQTQFVMREEESRSVQAVIERLAVDARARGVFVVDKAGQLIGEAGEMMGVDSTSLASLAAGCVAATGGLALIFGEEEFPTHYHQGERDNLHITLLGERMILLVVFDERSSLGLVRLRVKKAGGELARIFEEARKKSEAQAASTASPFADITDDDIDNLFSD